MYCPRCSKQFDPGTSYCRTCGLALDGVSDIVSGQAESEPIVTRRPNFKLFRIGIGVFILGLVIGLINGALKDFELFPQSYGKLIFMLFVAAGMLTLGAGFLFPTKKYSKRKPSELGASKKPQLAEPKHANDIVFPADTRELEPVASVTEHTTRDLDQV